MSTQQSASISVTNNTGGNADIVLFHSNTSKGVQRGAWSAAPGETVGPMTALFETFAGIADGWDYWSVMAFVKDGADAGLYINGGTVADPNWKECQLQSADEGRSITLAVSASSFDVALKSGGCTDAMTRLSPAATAPISHVFVLMLENHSFDNMLAMSGIPGIRRANTEDSNTYAGQTYPVRSGAPLTMVTDPGHEFDDVLMQLCGQNAVFPSGGPYPTINNGGFAASYATSTTEAPHRVPPASDVQNIMDCFDTETQLPVLYSLATNFTVCDYWYSSLPGPTWPNRFFLHGASSSGFDDSPTTAQMAGWEVSGFQYPNGSIFQRLSGASIPYQFYHDATGSDSLSAYSDDPSSGSALGAVPQVTSLAGVTLLDTNSLDNFAVDLQGPYPYPYTFIEPHYGDVTGGTYRGGSSQHPMDDVYGGEHLLQAVVSAIQNSPYWNSSVLVVCYDEHGGFYDSVPPPAAVAPGDDPDYGYNTHGFTFTTLGVRVPALVVSPLVVSGAVNGSVDHTPYDHSSVPKMLEDLWGLTPLTQRDAKASSPISKLAGAVPRTDRVAIPTPLARLHAFAPAQTPGERSATLAQPLPSGGNFQGALANVRKTHAALSGHPAAEARRATVNTRADAEVYAADILKQVRAIQDQRRRERRAGAPR